VRKYQYAARFFCCSRIALERATIESDSLVCEITKKLVDVLPSTAEHVKFRGNLSRPWDKAKYYLMTDSEQVP
jgi:hypothetical protein